MGRHAEAVCTISIGTLLYSSPNPEERTFDATVRCIRHCLKRL
jgi:hypothetical protein